MLAPFSGGFIASKPAQAFLKLWHAGLHRAWVGLCGSLNIIELKNRTSFTGIVVNDAADAITVRNIAAQHVRINRTDIAKRTSLETSLMPAGLVNDLTLTEFASLRDDLESLSAH